MNTELGGENDGNDDKWSTDLAKIDSSVVLSTLTNHPPEGEIDNKGKSVSGYDDGSNNKEEEDAMRVQEKMINDEVLWMLDDSWRYYG